MDARIYERIIIANGCLFKQNTNPAFVSKLGQIQLCLIFKYHLIHKDILASNMETTANMHDIFNILSHQCLLSANIKQRYQAVNIYFDNCYYFAFHIPRIRQIQPTHMPLEAKTSFFIFSKLINIVFRPILPFQMKFLLLHSKMAKDSILLTFYIDNIFRAFKFY